MLRNLSSTMFRGVMPMCTRSICFRPNLAINGFGRIGKMLLRQSFGDSNINVIAVNQPWTNIQELAHSLKFDTIHGVFNETIEVHNQCLRIGGKMVRVLNEEYPEDINWAHMGVEYVIDSTGKFTDKEQAIRHINSGAKKVIVTSPSTNLPMFVKGVNFNSYQQSTGNIVSSSSCTTNCATPIIKIIHDKFTVTSCMLYTVHALTASQAGHDGCNTRSALDNTIVTTTGASKAIGLILEDLKNKVVGDAARVPILSSSLLKLYMNVSEDVSIDAIKEEIVNKSQCALKNVVNYVDTKHVSSDFIGSQYSAVVDFNMIDVKGTLITIGAWYDNETAYACRVLDLAKHMMTIDELAKK